MVIGRFDSAPRALLYRFVPTSQDDDYEYWRGFCRAWATPEVLVNVEHDMEYSSSLVAELLACPHPLCTHAYQMHIPYTYYAHSTRADAMDGYWIDAGQEWAAYSGLGFCKVTPEARTAPLGRSVWRGVEWAVNAATTTAGEVGRKWHVHWPGVSHDHYPDATVPIAAPGTTATSERT